MEEEYERKITELNEEIKTIKSLMINIYNDTRYRCVTYDNIKHGFKVPDYNFYSINSNINDIHSIICMNVDFLHFQRNSFKKYYKKYYKKKLPKDSYILKSHRKIIMMTKKNIY